MKETYYKQICENLYSGDVVSLLTQIYEYKGKQDVLVAAKADALEHLVEIAKIQSTDGSNRIEGIYTSNERLKLLVKDKTTPQNRDEQEIAGYRDVLTTIHESHDYIPLKTGVILQFHRDLYKFSGKSIGGNYKTQNNAIEEEDAHGNKSIRFQPLDAWETPEAMEKICNAFDKAIDEHQEPLLIIPIFILDFLCIHPFSDGNGRMSRLLTLHLLYRAGFTVGKYISIEKLIERSKETYYEVLQASSFGWHEGTNDYSAFIKYSLGIILAAYRDLMSRKQIISYDEPSKSDRIRDLIEGTLGKITKREILDDCPDISQVTVQRALRDLIDSGDIIKIGGGRYTEYIWNREK